MRRLPSIPKTGRFWTIVSGTTAETLQTTTFLAPDEEAAFEAARRRGKRDPMYACEFIPPVGFALVPADMLRQIASTSEKD